MVVASLGIELRGRAILGSAGRFECVANRPRSPGTLVLMRAENWNVQPYFAVSFTPNRCPCVYSMRQAALVLHTGVGHLGFDLSDNLGFGDSLCERPSQRKQGCAQPVRHGPLDIPQRKQSSVISKHGVLDVSPGPRPRSLQTPACSATGKPQLRGEFKLFHMICWTKRGLLSM